MTPAAHFMAVAVLSMALSLVFAITGFDLATVVVFAVAGITNGLLAIATAITSRRTT